MFKVIIIGGKETNNYLMFEKKCIRCLQNKAQDGIMIYSTGDEFVEKFAKRFNIDIRLFYADFKTYGNNALKQRNIKLFEDANAVIAFDNGIKDVDVLVSIAKEKGMPYRLINLNK